MVKLHFISATMRTFRQLENEGVYGDEGPADPNKHVPYWILRSLTPILCAVIGPLIYNKLTEIEQSFKNIGGTIEKINATAQVQNERIIRVEDAIMWLKENSQRK